jgi:predicted ester cyclase
MTTETQKMIERIPLEVINNNKFELIDEIYAPNYVEHTPQPGVPPTREGFKQTAMALKKAFPDLRYTIDDVIDGGDRIVHRLTASGTMKGDFAGMPATGKHATWTEVHIGRVVNGRLTEHWGVIDQLSMLVQLGVIESPARVPDAVLSSPTTAHRSPGGNAGAFVRPVRPGGSGRLRGSTNKTRSWCWLARKDDLDGAHGCR